jgi:hypothetical protein
MHVHVCICMYHVLDMCPCPYPSMGKSHVKCRCHVGSRHAMPSLSACDAMSALEDNLYQTRTKSNPDSNSAFLAAKLELELRPEATQFTALQRCILTPDPAAGAQGGESHTLRKFVLAGEAAPFRNLCWRWKPFPPELVLARYVCRQDTGEDGSRSCVLVRFQSVCNDESITWYKKCKKPGCMQNRRVEVEYAQVTLTAALSHAHTCCCRSSRLIRDTADS